MNYVDFLRIVGSRPVKASEKSLRLWHVIYDWVLNHGYADTADSPDFVAHVNVFRFCSTSTLNNHLRTMASVGLLKRNVLKRKLPKELKDELSVGFPLLVSGIESLPSRFVRYCLPGKECSRELKSAALLHAKIQKKFSELRSSNSTAIPAKEFPVDVEVEGKTYEGTQTVTGTIVKYQFVTMNERRKSDDFGYRPDQTGYMNSTAKQLLWELVMDHLKGNIEPMPKSR